MIAWVWNWAARRRPDRPLCVAIGARDGFSGVGLADWWCCGCFQ